LPSRAIFLLSRAKRGGGRTWGGRLIVGSVLLEIAHVCPGPGGGDHDAANVGLNRTPDPRPADRLAPLAAADRPRLRPFGEDWRRDWRRKKEDWDAEANGCI
jgi:hypothetical protein